MLILILLVLNKSQRIMMLSAYTMFIVYITLFTRRSGQSVHNFGLLWSYREMFTNRDLAIQVLSNIWLFISLGAMLCSLKERTWVILIAVGLSLLIEGTQLVFGLGLCEIDDIINNSIGALLGYGCYCEILKYEKKFSYLKRRHYGTISNK